VALYNVTAVVQVVDADVVRDVLGAGLTSAEEHVRATDVALGSDLHLTPYAAWWLTAPPGR
jgi:hypothetical protein